MPIDREAIAEIDPEILLSDGLDDAYIGLVVNTRHKHVAVYDLEKCISVLMDRDGMTYEEADEYLEHNTVCAYVGPYTPLYLRPIGCVGAGESEAPAGDRDPALEVDQRRVAGGLIRAEE